MESLVKISLLLFIFGSSLYTVDALDGVLEKGNCSAIPNCVYCPYTDGKAKCIKCRTPMFAYDEETNSCLRCNTRQGCHLCYNLTYCEKCFTYKTGPDSNNEGTCSACAPNCKICKRAGGGKCDICNEGYLKTEDDLCDGCGVANCKFCSDLSTCDTCNRGYYKVSVSQCSACVENCDYCTDSTTCKRCFEGFYLQNSQCVSCGNNCRSCKNSGSCTACKNGKISANGKCECSQNCLSCDTAGFGKCDTCQHGYKKTDDKVCQKV